jgi:hypothetical protein
VEFGSARRGLKVASNGWERVRWEGQRRGDETPGGARWRAGPTTASQEKSQRRKVRAIAARDALPTRLGGPSGHATP